MFQFVAILSTVGSLCCFAGSAGKREWRAPLIALGVLLLVPLGFLVFVYWALTHMTWGF